MGGLCGVVTSAGQGFTSTARDPAVARTGADKGTQKRGSSPRPPSRKPTSMERAAYNITGNIARDLTMGFSTFGQSGERQAETLRARGYSDDVIKDYQDRTAATQKRMREEMARSRRDDNDRPATTKPSPAPTVTETETAPASAEPPETTADAVGEAESKVLTDIEDKKGRASTIATTARGLMTEANTTGGKSLLGSKKKKLIA